MGATQLQHKHMRRLIPAMLAMALCGLQPAQAAPDSQVYESAYNYIITDSYGPVVAFRRMENGATLSAIDLSRPNYQVIPYTSYLFAPLFIHPNPQKVLSIGLGAGAFNRLFNSAYPAASLTTAEIDPMILDVAVRRTGFKAGPNNVVAIQDGRRYLKTSKTKWDWIVIDAYVRRSHIPAHLTTVEFFRLVKEHLTENGVMAVNVVSRDQLLLSMTKTIGAAFASNVAFAVPNSGNIVILATNQTDPHLAEKFDTLRDQSLIGLMKENNVDLLSFKYSLAQLKVPDRIEVLTDDFAPVEYLDGVNKN